MTRAVNTAVSGSGGILQAVYASLGSSFTATGLVGANYWVDLTGLSASITPTSTSSRIMIITNIYMGMTATSGGYQQLYRILRNSSTVAGLMGTSEGGRDGSTGRTNHYGSQTLTDIAYRMFMMSGTHIDSPASTSALTYSIQIRSYSSAPVVFVNRASTFQAGGTDYDHVPLSTMTLLEIAG